MNRQSKKTETRARILDGAGRGFRRHGYGGVGVDGLAKEAGVTSGAFYGNFSSKAVAFREVIGAGMADLHRGVAQIRADSGKQWRDRFVDFYLGDRRTCDLALSCALQSLTGEVARADVAARDAYENELRGVIDEVSDGLDGVLQERRQEAIALLALLSGAVSMARAVRDPALSEEIAVAAKAASAKLRDMAGH